PTGGDPAHLRRAGAVVRSPAGAGLGASTQAGEETEERKPDELGGRVDLVHGRAGPRPRAARLGGGVARRRRRAARAVGAAAGGARARRRRASRGAAGGLGGTRAGRARLPRASDRGRPRGRQPAPAPDSALLTQGRARARGRGSAGALAAGDWPRHGAAT